MLLSSLPAVDPDPIFELTRRFDADTRPNALNLGVGVHRDPQGRLLEMRAVTEAARRSDGPPVGEGYAPILGLPAFRAAVARLFFESTEGGVMQTPGGTGALASAMHLLARAGVRRVWLPRPTWGNHHALATDAGLQVSTWAALDASGRRYDEADARRDLAAAAPGDAVLVHATCHNPSGIDLTDDEWDRFATFCRRRRIQPIVDAAYLGFRGDFATDVARVRDFVGTCPGSLVATSFSKNMGLYGARVGALIAPGATPAMMGHLERIARTSWSNPPRPGAIVAAAILDAPDLTAMWLEELRSMRERLNRLRRTLGEQLDLASDLAAHRLRAGRGLFCLLPLDPDAIAALARDHAIHVLPSGRVNLAAIPDERVDEVATAFAAALANATGGVSAGHGDTQPDSVPFGRRVG